MRSLNRFWRVCALDEGMNVKERKEMTIVVGDLRRRVCNGRESIDIPVSARATGIKERGRRRNMSDEDSLCLSVDTSRESCYRV
jgi:hypothetical protein